MKSVSETEEIILALSSDFGTETLAFREALNRILAEDIRADRDLPPYNRVTMDGIAIRFAEWVAGCKTFRIAGTQAAGEIPLNKEETGACIEIMTGAAMPAGFDTIVRYEDLEIADDTATILYPAITKNHNIHYRGSDKKAGSIVMPAGSLITPAVVGIAASVGKSFLNVKKLPRVVIVSTGDELVEVHKTPDPWQIRLSNSYMLEALLGKYCIHPTLLHVSDHPNRIREILEQCLSDYDVLLLSGGISMGKYDHLPGILGDLGVECLAHKVSQRPGKPFWFGRKGRGPLVFAFPGNPVSACLCMVRYCLPWIEQSLGMNISPEYAVLEEEIQFKPLMTWFQQVKLHQDASGVLCATLNNGNGSGDFSNLAESDAFMELPAEKEQISRGEAYRVWRLK